jgi:hypothetical protein
LAVWAKTPVVEFPKAWIILDGEVRRSFVKRFPHGVLYVEDAGDILILAAMNLHRAPDYRKHRA